MKKVILMTSLMSFGFIMSPVFAHGDEDHSKKDPAISSPQAISTDSADLTEGEVRKVDKDARKITLKHGDIKNLGMPGMTMVFQVKNVGLLDTVKEGDKVKFKAEKVEGALVVSQITPMK